MGATALSRKQIKAIGEANKRLNIWQGSVRSGKTFSSILRFIKDLRELPPGDAVICGVSRESIGRNVLSEISHILGIPIPGVGRNVFQLFGRNIHLVGASDERAERKIRGSTFMLAYVDEITIMPESFFKMLLSRLSLDGAKLLGTTNTDSPMHWLKVHYLDKASNLDMASFHFNLDDNPSLSESYKDNLKKEYHGVWYDRYIRGDWVLAEGLIYSMFDTSIHIIDLPTSEAKYYTVGVDFGVQHPTCFILVGHNPSSYPNMWVENEYSHSASSGYAKTCDELAEDLTQFIGTRNVRGTYIDPSAAAFITSCRKAGVKNILECDNSVLDGIQYVSNLLVNGTLKICRNCTGLIKEMHTYSWDKRAEVLGIDRPQKINDDFADALRYSVVSANKKLDRNNSVTKDQLDSMWVKSRGISAHPPIGSYRGMPNVVTSF